MQERPATVSVQRPVNDDGVDLTLVRAMLRRTPTERLRMLQSFIDMVRGVRRPERVDTVPRANDDVGHR